MTMPGQLCETSAMVRIRQLTSCGMNTEIEFSVSLNVEKEFTQNGKMTIGRKVSKTGGSVLEVSISMEVKTNEHTLKKLINHTRETTLIDSS